MAVTVVLYTAPTSKAELGKSRQNCSIHQTPKSELACGKALLHKNASAARWIKNHVLTNKYNNVLLSTSSHNWRGEYKYHLWMKMRAKRWIRQAIRRSSYSSFPPHHSLWLCIHNHEASNWYDHDSGSNGHYGGLQMSWSWGYGIVGDAGNYSQAQQEWAAERGYRQGGISFLYHQWFNYDDAAGACLSYA